MKLAKCPTGDKHSWTFIKNVTVHQIGPRAASFHLKGKYRCVNCNLQKYGRHQHSTQETIK